MSDQDQGESVWLFITPLLICLFSKYEVCDVLDLSIIGRKTSSWYSYPCEIDIVQGKIGIK